MPTNASGFACEPRQVRLAKEHFPHSPFKRRLLRNVPVAAKRLHQAVHVGGQRVLLDGEQVLHPTRQAASACTRDSFVPSSSARKVTRSCQGGKGARRRVNRCCWCKRCACGELRCRTWTPLMSPLRHLGSFAIIVSKPSSLAGLAAPAPLPSFARMPDGFSGAGFGSFRAAAVGCLGLPRKLPCAASHAAMSAPCSSSHAPLFMRRMVGGPRADAASVPLEIMYCRRWMRASLARDEAVGKGVVINGLPILTVEPDLDDYYREHVMGGEGSFVIAIKRFEDFSEAIVKKLIAEIAMNEGVKRRRL